MLEAVDSSQPIMLRLLLLAEREVEMPGQVLVTDPRLAWLPIRFCKHPTVRSLRDSDGALMDRGVVPLAQQDQIVEIRAATGNPWHSMMSLQVPGGVAAGVLTHPIPDHQRPPLSLAHQPSAAAQSQHFAVCVNQCTKQRVVGGQPLRGCRLNRTNTSKSTPTPPAVAHPPHQQRGSPPGPSSRKSGPP
jgi:hypothetical protein